MKHLALRSYRRYSNGSVSLASLNYGSLGTDKNSSLTIICRRRQGTPWS
ncbi:MAG: hypothetical protein AAF808_21420 [Cyanobacteria bacterium P01_D01_bin.2]